MLHGMHTGVLSTALPRTRARFGLVRCAFRGARGGCRCCIARGRILPLVSSVVSLPCIFCACACFCGRRCMLSFCDHHILDISLGCRPCAFISGLFCTRHSGSRGEFGCRYGCCSVCAARVSDAFIPFFSCKMNAHSEARRCPASLPSPTAARGGRTLARWEQYKDKSFRFFERAHL